MDDMGFDNAGFKEKGQGDGVDGGSQENEWVQ
jgi:hypothetical protein